MSDKILKLSQAQTLYRDLRGRIDALPTNEDIPAVPVQDVQVNGASVLNQGVANFPYADGSNFGLVQIGNGLQALSTNHKIYTKPATASQIKAGTEPYNQIIPERQHESAFYGLAKAAGADMKDIVSTTVGIYPDVQKAAIQNMLGITDLISTEESSTATAAHVINSTFMMGGKLHRATAAIAIGDAVVVGTNCEVVKADEVFVKNTDYATTSSYGTIKISNGGGLRLLSNGLGTDQAYASQIKAGTDSYRPIVPEKQHEAVFYGLAKVAGVDMASSNNAVGTYTSDAKAAIRDMLGAIGTANIGNGLSAEYDFETGYLNTISANVRDVQINGTSIISSNIANIPIASTTNFGVVKIGDGLKIQDSKIMVSNADAATIKAGTTTAYPLVPLRQHLSTFYGLAKAAGADEKDSTLSAGTYTETAKSAIRSMLGAASSNVIAVQDEQPTDTDTKVWLPETEAQGIQVPTMEDMANYVLKTDLATTTTVGVVKAKDFGIKVNASGELYISKAEIASEVKPGAANYLPIVPSNQHAAVFYGLSKVAGVDLASETVTLGTYPATASAAIRTMLDAVGKTDIASSTNYGIVKVTNYYGVDMITIGSDAGFIRVYKAPSDQIKAGVNNYRPIVPSTQHEGVFYGLAKVAGADMASSSNAVGTYTTEAKAAIHTMLGIDPASIAAQVDIPLIETVTGTTPSITGQPNVRYVCGEVSTLSLTPPASGSMDVIFESSSTATTLTVPNTVKWPAWFDVETLEANTTYEILITDGIYGSVMTWAT